MIISDWVNKKKIILYCFTIFFQFEDNLRLYEYKFAM